MKPGLAGVISLGMSGTKILRIMTKPSLLRWREANREHMREYHRAYWQKYYAANRARILAHKAAVRAGRVLVKTARDA